MKKILIDTNKFLDFYRYKSENKEILDKLSKCDNIIISEQIIREFKRNRFLEIQRLLEVVKEKEKSLTNNLCNLDAVGIFSSDIIELNKENFKLIKEIKENFVPMENKISDMLDDENHDDVFVAFEKIITNPSTEIIEDNKNAYDLAVMRNRLGGIPRSDKNGFKYLTVCDEYIWESLLLNSKYDIIFVTRDKTYIDNSRILQSEFYKKTGRSIEFIELVSLGLIKLGENVSKEAVEIEQNEQQMLKTYGSLHDATGVDIDKLDDVLVTLTEREEDVVRLRFGLTDGRCRTLEEVSNIYGTTREEIRQIEAKALRKMRTRNILETMVENNEPISL